MFRSLTLSAVRVSHCTLGLDSRVETSWGRSGGNVEVTGAETPINHGGAHLEDAMGTSTAMTAFCIGTDWI
jgi:hypothetical protein